MPNIDHIIIRRIQSTDNKSLATIIRDTFTEMHLPKKGTVYDDPSTDDLYELFVQEGAGCLVAVEGSKILGSAGVFPTKGLPNGYAEFSKFYISPDGRNRGVGKQLLTGCIQMAKEMKYTHLYLESFPNLDAALKIYERYGFRNLSMPLGHSGHVACSIWQVLDLNNT